MGNVLAGLCAFTYGRSPYPPPHPGADRTVRKLSGGGASPRQSPLRTQQHPNTSPNSQSPASRDERRQEVRTQGMNE